jgi:DNA-binding transcriptional ArsR family regulator
LPSDQDLLSFVREHIRSVWALELLLLLRRNAERCWRPAELVAELRASQALVSDNLSKLQDAGLAVRDDDGCWRYAPAAPVLDALCDDLEAAYRQRPVAVVNMIAKPANPLQSLADAFKFRGDGK